MVKESIKGNYHSLSDVVSQSKIMIFFAISFRCGAELCSRLGEVQDKFFIEKENLTEAKL